MAYPQQQYYAPYPQQQYYTPNNGAAVDMLNQYKYGQPQPMPMQQPMQQMPQPMPQMQTPANDRIYVLGEVEATSYPVAPGNTVTMWDKNNPTLYVKSVNMQGVPSMCILDYQERTQGGQNKPTDHQCHCAGKYPSIDEFNALREKFEALSKEFEEYKKGGAE